jgi:UTP:GlnB (protein PII) uridylyltransferase
MKTKTFDCVEMKRKAALRIYEETKDLSLEDREGYWRRKNEAFLAKREAREALQHTSGIRTFVRSRLPKTIAN